MLKLKMANFVSTLRFVEQSPPIVALLHEFRPITFFFIGKWVMYIAALSRAFNECTQIYMNCTITYDNVQHIPTRCSTIYNNVQQKILPYDSILAPKSVTWKTFFLIHNIT